MITVSNSTPFMLSDSNQLLASSPLPLISVMLKFNLRSHMQFLLLEIVYHFFLLETVFSLSFQAPTLSWFLWAPLAPLFIPLPSPTYSTVEFPGLHLGPPLFSLCPHSIPKFMASNTFHVPLSP